MTKISVVMSIYNGEQFIDESINSVLDQNFKNFEFLIMDDASVDKTFEILKFYKKKNQKIKIFRNKNRIGLTKSLIRLISKAKGILIARLDVDDICQKNRLIIQKNWLLKSNKNALIGTSGYKININNEIIGKYNLKNLKHDKLIKKLLFKNYLLHSSVMFKKKYYKIAGGYNPNYQFAQDYDLWLKISKHGNIKNINKNLVSIREHANSISKIKRKQQSINAFIISCLNQTTNFKLNSYKNNKVLKQLSKISDIKKHFNVMSYLYSEFIPSKFSKNIFQLNLNEFIYLLNDFSFFIRKTIRKYFTL